MRLSTGLSSFCLCALVTSRVCAPGNLEAARWETYETPVGPSQRFELTDGDSVDLNTDTRLRAFIGAHSRVLLLERGEAFFRAQGAPLRVNVRDLSIGADKASFSVRNYAGGDVDVMALNGRIRIDSAPVMPSDSSRLAHRVSRFLPAGQIASVHLGIVSVRTIGRANIQSKLLWLHGMLEFVGEPLENVAAEFNRYSRTRLVIDDESIRNFRVGGRFSAFDLDSLVATISKIFALHAQTRLTASGQVVGLRLDRPVPISTGVRVPIEQ